MGPSRQFYPVLIFLKKQHNKMSLHINIPKPTVSDWADGSKSAWAEAAHTKQLTKLLCEVQSTGLLTNKGDKSATSINKHEKHQS